MLAQLMSFAIDMINNLSQCHIWHILFIQRKQQMCLVSFVLPRFYSYLDSSKLFFYFLFSGNVLIIKLKKQNNKACS